MTVYPYKTVPVLDAQGNTFEAYELRHNGKNIFIDVRAAEVVGGIENLRNRIVPHHMIVCEVLK